MLIPKPYILINRKNLERYIMIDEEEVGEKEEEETHEESDEIVVH